MMKMSAVLVLLVSACVLLNDARGAISPHTGGGRKTIEALNTVLNMASNQDSSTIFVTTKNTPFVSISEVGAPWGSGVFEVPGDSKDANLTQAQLSRVIAQARQLREVSWSVTVVLVSDDQAFIASFTQLSLEGRLLVWSTRLLVLTHLPLHQLNHIRHTLAMTNSMVIVLNDDVGKVFVYLPYDTSEADAIMVARWSYKRGLQLTSHLSFFPQKFNTLSTGPRLRVSALEIPTTKIRIVADPDAPGGKRVITMSPEVTLLETIAQAMNFTIKMYNPVDGGWGVKLANGSWNGMLGMAKRKEVDIGLGLFHITPARAEVVDLTFPAIHWYVRIISRRGRPEVDPWGFLLPLNPVVWVGILVALLAIALVIIILPCFIPNQTLCGMRRMVNISSCVRVLLHQEVLNILEWWWWERVVLGVWMLMMLILTQSYAGNLMSLLAVRYIPLPIQSLQDILNNAITVLVPRGTTVATSFLGMLVVLCGGGIISVLIFIMEIIYSTILQNNVS